MSTLVIKKYIVFTIFVLVFGLIYEHFSFGVISYYMLGAFLIPLLLGICINLIFNGMFNKYGSFFYNNGVITLTIGSLIKGVLDIYGTTSILLKYYLIFGLLFIFISVALNLLIKENVV